MRVALAFGVVLALALLAPLLAGTSSALAINATIDGPSALAPSQGAEYNITIFGGPSTPVNYTLVYWITGANLTGGSPPSFAPGRVTGEKTAFIVNITAPGGEETISLFVQVTGSSGGTTFNTTAEKPIVIVRPIVLSATFHNSASTAAVNVTVRIYVDNAFVGTTTLKSIAANADASVTYNYLPVGLQPGQHSVRIEADLNGNGIIEPNLGEVLVSDFFYTGVLPSSAGWSLLLGIAVFFPVFLGVVAFRRRTRK